jgi:hypothetical protein
VDEVEAAAHQALAEAVAMEAAAAMCSLCHGVAKVLEMVARDAATIIMHQRRHTAAARREVTEAATIKTAANVVSMEAAARNKAKHADGMQRRRTVWQRQQP